MIGIVLCGHAQFASGLYSSINLIAGEQEAFQTVDFSKEMSSELLQEKLTAAVEAVDQRKGIVIFTDIPGGTPFNQAVMLSTKMEGVKVISGTNLPALLEGSFNRENSLESFIVKILDSGKAGLQQFEQRKKEANQSEAEDGI